MRFLHSRALSKSRPARKNKRAAAILVETESAYLPPTAVPMGRIPAWAVVLLISREITITTLRSIAGEMVSVVARASGPDGVRVDGLKVHVAPEGKPPVQANLMVEWKPSVGLMLRVMGFEALP